MKYYEEHGSKGTRLYSETDLRRMYRLNSKEQESVDAPKGYSSWLKHNISVTKRFTEIEASNVVGDRGYRTILVNLFGAPSAGKSTLAHRLVAALSMDGYLSEYVPEYAKELIYDEQRTLLDGTVDKQRVVSGEQMHRVERLLSKVEVIVTDSPALLGVFYADATQPEYDEFATELRKWHQNQNAINVFVDSARLPFDQRGRKHTEAESVKLQELMLDEVLCTQFFKRQDGGLDNFDELMLAIESQVSATRINQALS